jgi:exopolysaccharide biosynthesis polyprenyl glycosylphosphotransferase
MSPNIEHPFVCLTRRGYSQQTTVKVATSPKVSPGVSAFLENGVRVVEKATPSLTRIRRKHRWEHLTPTLGSSRLGWAVVDFVAGVICGTYGAFLGHPGFLLPKGVSALEGNGFLFGLSVALFTRYSDQPRAMKDSQALREFLLLSKDVSLSALIVGSFVILMWRVPISQTLLETEIGMTVCLMIAARIFWRWRRLHDRRRGKARKNFVIVGLGPEARKVRDYLQSLRYAGYTFKGFVALDPTQQSDADQWDAVIGSIGDIMPRARSMFVDELFFMSRPKTAILVDAIEAARAAGVDVRLIPDIGETLHRRTDVHYIGDLPTVVLHQSETQEVERFAKRLLDIVCATVALAISFPIIVVLGLLIKLDSPGPIFYVSDRVGLKGRTFRCYKLRTMVRNAHALRAELVHLNERDGVLFKIKKDPRMTGVGALLRKYSLDELPQFWNVLVGDMSMVGPRPPITSEVQQYTIDQFCRLEVMPGITGLWQVEARHDPSFESYIELDRKYVSDWSIWLDLKILLRTATVVARGTGT